MRRTILFCLALLVLTQALAHAQPAIASNGVLNAFSYLPDVARGSWFVIFGTGLGPAAITVQPGPPFPTSLSGTSITFTPVSGGTSVSALMYYTLANQIAGLLPSSTAAGAYDVTVTYNGQTSASARVNVVERNFGIAAQAANGQGPAQATYGGYDLNRFTTATLGQWSTRPANPGNIVVLWGTGLGADPSSDVTGGTSGDQTAAGQVRVIVAGTEVTPLYSGRSSGSPGLDQINFAIPAAVSPSCVVNVQVRVGAKLSNLGSIAVASAGQTACASPTLSEAQMQTLDRGGTLTVGAFFLAKSALTFTSAAFGTITGQSEHVAGWFGKYGVDTIATADFALVQSGACFVLQRAGTMDQIGFGSPPQALDAGAQVTLSGPNATNLGIPRQSNNSYDVTLYKSGLNGIGRSGTPTLTQGTYTLTGAGGSAVGPFSATLSFPGDFVWTNQNSIADPIPRGSPLTITWSGGGTGMVTISGMALTETGGTTRDPIYSAKMFTCAAQASAGSFTVPASLLQQLPAVSGDMSGASFGALSVLAAPDLSKGQGMFTAPLTAGGTIDQAFMHYGVTYIKATGFN